MNLNQVTIPSLDVEKATEFYKILGLRLIVDAIPKYVRFECPEGDATFSIHKTDVLPRKGGVMVYFECEHLDNKVVYLQEKGIVFKQLPKNQSWLWREARLEDLDGNSIVLYNAGTNRKNPPWRIE